mmetsp:Transcript_16698/g.41753  ORF Transcript_16698/g.41753 Transcript_16698/m.41753 type:complete len:248 (+) Transcript_16698:1117-1860(+)
MPHPMCAAWIMPTSLAPSPMPSVMAPHLTCTSLVTAAFCMGLTRQHTTDLHALHSAMSASWCSFLSASASAPPSMTRPTLEWPCTVPGGPVGTPSGGGGGSRPSCCMRMFSISTSSSFSRSTCASTALAPAPSSLDVEPSCRGAVVATPAVLAALTKSRSRTSTSAMSSVKSLQDSAMEMAVSTLSPVSTHSRMPPAASCLMHVGTPSCSLSSMAVQPSSCRLFSTSSLSALSRSSRSLPSDVLAST